MKGQEGNHAGGEPERGAVAVRRGATDKRIYDEATEDMEQRPAYRHRNKAQGAAAEPAPDVVQHQRDDYAALRLQHVDVAERIFHELAPV